MLRTRVIPVLLLRDKGLVKTVKFDKAKYIGDPINAVKLFNDKEVDELVFLDIDASKENRKPNFELVKNIASECFMPLGYGGGISTIDDVKQLFSIGVEKVIINSNALYKLDLITEASRIFGDQSIVVSIDVTKSFLGKYQIYSHSKKKSDYSDPIVFAQVAEKAGAGEIMINAVEKDGTMSGYDYKLIEMICKSTKVPIVVCGGAGQLSDLKKAVDAGASGVGVGSLFIYHGPHKAVLINYPTQSELKKILE
jgi:imidazole glycerol-phosphate synthase subunit HisF